MNPEEHDPGLLWDMLEAVRAILEYTDGLTSVEYLNRRMVQRAVERELEILGEAARGLSSEFRESNSDVPWSKIIGLRNIIAHEYGEVLQERLWRLIQQDVPELVEQLERLQSAEP